MILSAEDFVNLRTSGNPEEYRRAAFEDASEKVWMDVINNYPQMKVWVIINKTVPLSILHILSDDPDNNVRAAIAAKRKLDNALFEKLARDEDESVRQRIACHKKAPIEILALLSTDTKRIVSDAAQERLNIK